MRLTRSVSYALGVLLQIDQVGRGAHVTAASIARGCRFPPRFLYRILRRLVDAGLLRGTSGPGGGYALAKRPPRITLLEIVEAVESRPEPTVLEAVCSNHRLAIERINRLCRLQAEDFVDALREVTLAQLEKTARKPTKKKKKKAQGRRASPK